MRTTNLKRVRNIAMFFVVAAVWIFYFFPIYWMVSSSFKTPGGHVRDSAQMDFLAYDPVLYQQLYQSEVFEGNTE